MRNYKGFSLALINNGIEDFLDYSLIEVIDDFNIKVINNKTKEEKNINVLGDKNIKINSNDEKISKSIKEKNDNIIKEKEKSNDFRIKYYLDKLKQEYIIGESKNTIKDITENTTVENIKNTVEEKKVIKEKKEISKENYPRGWAFKNKFIDNDGNVYFKGILQPEL